MVDETQSWTLFALILSSIYINNITAFYPATIGRSILIKERPEYRTKLFEQGSKEGKRSEEVKFVEWAGCKGLLPLHRYKNVMNAESYSGWLCKQLPLASTEDTSMVESKTSLKFQAESKAAQVLNPLVDLRPIYVDSHIVAVNKPSGALSGET